MKYIRKSVTDLNKKINELALVLEKLKLSEYLEYLNNPRRTFIRTLWHGIAKGLGAAIGFTVLGALVIYILSNTFLNNLPVIGDLISEILKIVNAKMGMP